MESTTAIDISHWRKVRWEEVPDEVNVVFIKELPGSFCP